MHNTITNRQMVFLVFLTLITHNLLTIPYLAAQSSGRGGWVPILITAIFFSLASIFITKLNLMFKDRVFFDYSQDIVGKFFRYILIIYFLVYFLGVFLYLACNLFSLMDGYFLPESPHWAYSLMAFAIFALITIKGITNIARIFELIGPVLIIFSLIVYALSLTQGIQYNLLPLFDIERIADYFMGTKDVIIPFLGIEILLIVPFTQKNLKSPRFVSFTIISIGIYYVIVFFSTLNVIGLSNLLYYKTPVIEAIRLVKIPVIERVDILYLIFGFIGLFLGIVIVFSAVTELLCRLIPKANRSLLVSIIGAFIYFSCLFLYDIKNMEDILDQIILYSGIASAIIIPATLFFIAKVKKHGQKTA